MSWGVVATVKEPPSLLAAFAAHYAAIGASEIFVYLDAVTPGAEQVLADVPGCQVILADRAYYRDVWGSDWPDNFVRRQRLNATHAFRNAQVDWLLHADADEYVLNPDLNDELDALPASVDSITIPNGERVFADGAARQTIFDGYMLSPTPMRPWRIRQLFADDIQRYSDRGFLGHRLGKSLSRVGRDFKIGVHAPRAAGSLEQTVSEHSVLCHFDGMTALHWMLKLLRYKDAGLNMTLNRKTRARYEQLQYILNTGSELDATQRLHDMLRLYPQDRVDQMQEAGLITPIPAVAAAASATLAHHAIDLTPEAFDAHLALSMPEQFAQIGPETSYKKAGHA